MRRDIFSMQTGLQPGSRERSRRSWLAAPILGLALASGGLYAGTQSKIIDHDCEGVSLVVTSEDRFDPLIQRLLLEKQLGKHPQIEDPKYLVIPAPDDAELTEIQIRYLERLLDSVRP